MKQFCHPKYSILIWSFNDICDMANALCGFLLIVARQRMASNNAHYMYCSFPLVGMQVCKDTVYYCVFVLFAGEGDSSEQSGGAPVSTGRAWQRATASQGSGGRREKELLRFTNTAGGKS